MNSITIEQLGRLSSQEKRALLTQIYTKQLPKSRMAPMSFAQERIWRLDRLEPGNSAFNITTAYRLTGQLDVGILEQSLNQMGQRHDVLHTTFATVDDRPVQVIAGRQTIKLTQKDWRGLSKIDLETWLQQQVLQEHHYPFDLSCGPLLRASLLHLAEGEYILILTTHRIIFDGQCWPILTSELAAFYRALGNGVYPLLPELPLQYADFAGWQREWLTGKAAATQMTYWQKKLDGRARLLQLPTDHPRTAAQSRSNIHPFTLPESLSQSLRHFSQQEGISQFVTLLAIFQLLLYRYTAQEDFLVFSSVAGRNRPELKYLFGLFANVLPLRADMSGTPNFRELLERVRETAADAFAHQDIPFEQVLETLRVERDQKYTPIFQVMFVFWPEPIQPPEWPGLTIEPIDIDLKSAEFDLYLHLTNTQPEMKGALRYKADLFEAETIAEWVTQFQVLLSELMTNPDQPISNLMGNSTQAEQGVVTGAVPLLPGQWSYLQTPELWVNMVEVIELAQPLNPIWLEQAVQCILIQHDALRASFTQEGGRWEQSFQAAVETTPFVYSNLSHLPITERVMAMKTSLAAIQSSLGPLKSRLMQVNYFDLGMEQTGYLVLTIHHVIADNGSLPILLEDLHTAYQQLSQGQPVCLPAKTTSVKSWAERLYKYLQSVAFQRQLKQELAIIKGRKAFLPVDYPESRNKNTLESTAKVKGALSVEETEVLLKEFPRFYRTSLLTALLTALVQTITHWSEERDLTLEIVDMGRYLNLPGAQNVDLSRAVGCLFVPGILVLERPKSDDPIQTLQLVSKQLERLPMSGLAIGLVRQVEYYKEEVVDDIPTAELRLNYLGQTSLPDLPGWSPQTSTAVEDFVPNRRHTEIDRNPLLLNCAAVITNGQLIISWEYSQNIHRQTTIEQVANGVLGALQAMVGRHRQIRQERGDTLSENVFVAPRTPTEKKLATIWAEVFGLEQVGVYDNFYEIGGDSLLALRIISQAKQVGLNFTTQQLIHYQRIAELAAIEGITPTIQAEQGLVSGLVPLTPRGAEYAGAQQPRPWWKMETLYEMPAEITPKIVAEAVRQLVLHHDGLRLRVVQDDFGYQLFIAPTEDNVFQEKDLSGLTAAEQEKAFVMIAEEQWASLNLTTGPLARFTYINCGLDRPAQLLITIHHFVADGYSLLILLEDFATACQQLVGEKIVELPLKTVSLKAWAEWAKSYAQSQAGKQELYDYWLALPWGRVQPLPLDYPENLVFDETTGFIRNTYLEAGVDSVWGGLDEPTTKILSTKVPQVYKVDIMTVLLTALSITFQRWAKTNLLYIILTNNGRSGFTEIDLSRTIGEVVSSHSVLLELADITTDYADIFRSIKEQIDHIPNRGNTWDWLKLYYQKEIFAHLPQLIHALFLYHGNVDEVKSSIPFQPIDLPTRAIPLPVEEKREMQPFDCTAMIKGGQFVIKWEYKKALHKRSTVEELVKIYLDVLRSFVDRVRG